MMRDMVLPLVLIMTLGLVVYSNVYDVPFVWDDERLMLDNPVVRDVRVPFEALKHDEELYKVTRMRFVGMLTFALNYRLHGTNVAGYHAVNVAIHLLNAALVFLLVRAAFTAPVLARSSLAPDAAGIALTAALLFVVHPVQTEAVTYIFQRLASLATLFYLASLLLYIRSRTLTPETGVAVPAARGRAVLLLRVSSLVAAVLGMWTKEIVFTLPLTVTLAEAVFFEGGLRRRAAGLVPYWLTLAVIPLLYLVGMERSLGAATREFGHVTFGRLEYLLTQFRVVATYLRLLVLPVHQNIDYDYAPSRSLLDPGVLPSLGLLAFLFAGGGYLLYRSRKGDGALRFIAFGILWFFLTLSIESSIIPLRLLINEFRVYLPSVGAFLAAAGGLFLLQRRIDWRPFTIAIRVFIVCAVAALSLVTFQRNALWADEVAFWEDTKRESPRKFVPPYNLGCALYDRGRYHEAIREFQFTLTLNPSYHEAYEKLGEAYFKLGDLRVAEGMFREAARLKPDYARPHINLGILLDEQGRTDEALAELQKALVLDPGNARIHDDLGVVHVRRQEYAAAEREFLSALRLDPGAATVYVHLGIAYELQGRYNDAVAAFRTAVRLNSGDADAHYRLGAAYARLGRSDEARLELQQALALQPGHAAAGQELARLQNRPGTTPGGGKK